MAGKLHASYADYTLSKGPAIAPGTKLARAYAEGYRLYESGGGTQPYPQAHDPLKYAAWLRGVQDAQAGFPPTHAGGPQAIPVVPDPQQEEPEPTPEPGEEEPTLPAPEPPYEEPNPPFPPYGEPFPEGEPQPEPQEGGGNG